jgi:hypothetical protein
MDVSGRTTTAALTAMDAEPPVESRRPDADDAAWIDALRRRDPDAIARLHELLAGRVPPHAR